VRLTSDGFTPPGPQPCQTLHGYRFINAHHDEVAVSADGIASAPPSEAAAAAQPAGGGLRVHLCGVLYEVRLNDEIVSMNKSKAPFEVDGCWGHWQMPNPTKCDCQRVVSNEARCSLPFAHATRPQLVFEIRRSA
jgi:hypothetical protein